MVSLSSDKQQKMTPFKQKTAREQAQIVRRVVGILESTYGHPRHGNPQNPLDDLIYIQLSNKTARTTSRRVYRNLKRRFPSWNEVPKTKRNLSVLKKLLNPAGLSDVKSKQIFDTLVVLKKRYGRCTLSPLKHESSESAEKFLILLPGTSTKVAKCVLMYAFEREVLPVDVHVHRVATRLGWTSRKRADQCHDELEEIVKPKYRYSFHVGCISHGREICRPQNPDCPTCPLRKYCDYAKSQATSH